MEAAIECLQKKRERLEAEVESGKREIESDRLALTTSERHFSECQQNLAEVTAAIAVLKAPADYSGQQF